MIKKHFLQVVNKVLSVRTKKNLLLKYFATYFLVMLFPLIIGYAYYINTYRIVYSDAISENNILLKQASSILEQRFEEANSISGQIVANSLVNAFQGMRKPLEYPNSYSIIRTRDSLTNYNTSNKFISNYFIFFNKSEIVMNNQIIYTYEEFYKHYMSFKGLTYDNWHKQITQMISAGGLSGEIEAELYVDAPSGQQAATFITYSKSLLSYGQNDGMVMLFINKKAMTDLLSSINTENGGITYIQNKTGRIITYYSHEKYDIRTIQAKVNKNISNTSNTTEILLNGKEMMVNYIKTHNNDYTYVAVQSKKTILAKAENVKVILYIVLFISFFIGAFISFLMAKRSAKPLQDILSNPQLIDSSGDIFENIKFTINELGTNNLSLEKTIDEQIPILRTTFITRLIHGEFTSEDELANVSRYIHLNHYERVYCIVIFKFDTDINNYDTLELSIVNTFKQLLKDSLIRVIPDAMTCDLNEQQLVLLLDYPEAEQEKLNHYVEDVADRVRQEMPKNTYESLLISCGTVVNRLIDIPASFEKAKLAFNKNSADIHSNVLWYAETGQFTVDYFFPADLQTKLINNVKTGDKAAVKAILTVLFKRNLIESSLSSSFQRLFVYELLGIVIKLGNQIGLDESSYNYITNNMNNIDKYSDLKQLKMITDSYYLLCEIMNGQSDKHSLSVINEITEYINAYFFDSNISLASIADKFNMNESYLSYIFKQQSGIKLSSYIENLRIQKAKELLDGTSLTISDISEKTGYLSANTFCRAFRRVTGINATTFRGQKM